MSKTVKSMFLKPISMLALLFVSVGSLSLPAQAVGTPTVSSVDVPASGRYAANENLTFVVNFSTEITVSGTPTIDITLDQGGVRAADYVSGSGNAALTFTYKIEPGVADVNGIALASAISLNGGTLKDSANTNANLNLAAVGSLSSVTVGGLIAYEPFLHTGSQVDLAGKAGESSRGFTGSWATVNTRGSVSSATSVKLDVNTDGKMKFPSNVGFSLPANDGKAKSLGNWSPSHSARQLVSPISLDKPGVLYLSFLLRDTDTGKDGQSMMGFLTGLPTSVSDSSKTAINFGYTYSPAGANRGQFGIDVGPANWMAFCSDTATSSCSGGNSYSAQTSIAGGVAGYSNPSIESWFMVAEITTVSGAGNDTIKMKRYAPTDSLPATAPSSWDLTLSRQLTGTITHASLQLESTTAAELDEMRIASNYVDVVGLSPVAPTAVSCSTAGNGLSASVSFTHAGGAGITYLATATPLNGGTKISATGSSSPVSITGLSADTSYACSVAAVSSAGIGESASPAPGTPGTPAAIAGVSQATITVNPPSLGGLPSSYTVTSTPGNLTCTVLASDSPLACTITGLTNNTSYTFSVKASGPGGTSSASASSASVTPAAVAPTTYVVTYDTHGGPTVTAGSFQSGGSVALPANPSLAGFRFLGWFASATGGTALTSPYSPGVTSAVTIHAQWASTAAAAPSLSFVSAAFVLNQGTAANIAAPDNSGGAPTTWSISPSLPAGLTLNTGTGAITGTPTSAQSATSYSLRGENSGGSSNVSLTIAIQGVLVGPNIAYGNAIARLTVGSSTSINAPTNSGGTVASWSISPSLPSGLSLNTSSGVISGTPAAVTAAADYTITATNSANSDTTILNIEIVAASSVINLPPVAEVLRPLIPVKKELKTGDVQVLIGSNLVEVRTTPSAKKDAVTTSGDDWNITYKSTSLSEVAIPLDKENAIVLVQGNLAQVSGTGFQPNTELKVYLFSEPKLIGTVLADATGTFGGKFKVPTNLESGEHSIQVLGYSKSGEIRIATIGVTAKAANPKATVVFAPDSFKLSPAARSALKKLALEIKAKSVPAKVNILTTVHGSANSAKARLVALSRGKASADYLRSLGVNATFAYKTRFLNYMNTKSRPQEVVAAY